MVYDKAISMILMVILVNRLNQLYDLVGGAITILKNMKVNGRDDIPYEMENKIHVPSHQLVWLLTIINHH